MVSDEHTVKQCALNEPVLLGYGAKYFLHRITDRLLPVDPENLTGGIADIDQTELMDDERPFTTLHTTREPYAPSIHTMSPPIR